MFEVIINFIWKIAEVVYSKKRMSAWLQQSHHNPKHVCKTNGSPPSDISLAGHESSYHGCGCCHMLVPKDASNCELEWRHLPFENVWNETISQIVNVFLVSNFVLGCYTWPSPRKLPSPVRALRGSWWTALQQAPPWPLLQLHWMQPGQRCQPLTHHLWSLCPRV